MAKQTEETTIEVPSRSGLRGRIDRLAHEYMLKASALKIASEILDEDDRKTALALAPKKFLQAITHRNGNEPEPAKGHVGGRKSREERISEITEYLREHPGATTTEISEALGWLLNQVLKYAGMVAKRTKVDRGEPSHWTLKAGGTATTVKGTPKLGSTRWYVKPAIHGKPMTLFILEHLMDKTEQSAEKLMQEFGEAESPLKSVRILNAPMGALIHNGYIKKTRDGYRRTVKGMKRMVEMRGQLEASGKVQVGGYMP